MDVTFWNPLFIKVTWISRDFYDYETYEESDKPVDNIEYVEEGPYDVYQLPAAEEFAGLYEKCGLEAWEVKESTRKDNYRSTAEAVWRGSA